MDEKRRADLEARRARVRMPNTAFYDRILPLLLLVLGVAMLALIVIGVAIALGITPWR